MKKFYLAHARIERLKIRQWELEFEKSTGIELVNPFFDSEGNDKEMNHLDQEKYSMISEQEKILLVEKDKQAILESDGLISIISCKSWGTAMEILFAFHHNKPVYLVVENGDHQHPWLVAHSTKIFFSEKQLKQHLISLQQ